MKVLFLDIDGVLNADEDFYDEEGAPKKRAPWMTVSSGERYYGISQPRLRRLKRIIDETGAAIILVSSWKIYYLYYKAHKDDEHIGKYLCNALSRQKIHIYDTTLKYENWGTYYRGHGIKLWILNWDQTHPDDPVESYVILDDEEFDYEESGLTSHVVRTESFGRPGLTDEWAERAIRILGKGEGK